MFNCREELAIPPVIKHLSFLNMAEVFNISIERYKIKIRSNILVNQEIRTEINNFYRLNCYENSQLYYRLSCTKKPTSVFHRVSS